MAQAAGPVGWPWSCLLTLLYVVVQFSCVAPQAHAARLDRLLGEQLADSTDRSAPFLLGVIEPLVTLYPAQMPTAFPTVLRVRTATYGVYVYIYIYIYITTTKKSHGICFIM
jgi:hypothetical protein